ncbi:RING/U-box superfamily protein [Rhynchospora pubera]|uniref:RING/U-box superfamily protein n=1 Tax=Rhynchospora pubera TaxID=906938 RepID=A0AAV8E3Y4_9POAL|nr:RING/U-box superfamily protein [Rhynchospora pubera]
MEGSTAVIRRRSLTLSDQLSTVHPQTTNLRDLLKLPDSSDPRGNQRIIHMESSDPSSGYPWRTLRDLLQLQPSVNPEPSPSNEASHEVVGGGRTTEAQPRVSLMTLLEEGERNQTSGSRRSERHVASVEPRQVSGQDDLVRVSLLALLEQSERNFPCGSAYVAAEAEEEEEEHVAEEERVSLVCCVCMVRRKGAAFIPCGHTFCRRCSRELHMGRGTCPLCNGVITEVLDIF